MFIILMTRKLRNADYILATQSIHMRLRIFRRLFQFYIICIFGEES